MINVLYTVTKNHKTMNNTENTIRLSETKYIRNRTRKLAGEQLEFMGGKRLGDVSIRIEDNACCRKIRRNVSNQFKNLFGIVPEGFRYCA